MPAKKKTNPRKVPVSLSDVEHARYEGRMQGSQLMLTAVVWILCEKHDAPAEDVKQLSHEIQYLLENIAAGNVSFPLVKRTLKEEYNWEVNFYVDETRTRKAVPV